MAADGSPDFKILAAITAITAIGVFTGAAVLSPIEVRFLQTLTLDTTLIGAKFSIAAAFSGIFALIVGRLAVRYGKSGFLLAAAIIGTVAPLFYAASSSIFQYMGVAVVASFAGGALGPLISSIFQDALAKNRSRGKYIGIYYSVSALAGSIGAFTGGVAADAYGLRAPYYIDALIGAFGIFVVLAFLIKYKNHAALSGKNHLSEKRDILFSIRYIAKDPVLIFHFILQSAFGFYWAMKPIIYPLAVFAIAKSNTATGSVFAAMGIVAMIVLPFAGHYVDKRGYLSGAKIGYAFLGVSSVALAFSKTLPMFFLFAGLFAVGEAINGPMSGVIEVKRIKNHHRTELMGFYAAHSSLLSIISPLIAGALLLFLSVMQVLLIYSLILWAGMAAAFIIRKQSA